MPTRSLQKNPRAEFLKRQWSHGLALTLSGLTLLLVAAALAVREPHAGAGGPPERA